MLLGALERMFVATSASIDARDNTVSTVLSGTVQPR
jgi:hypothetical protein